MKNTGDTLQVEITIAQNERRSAPRRQAKPTTPHPPTIPRTTRLMALAIKFQDMVDRREIIDYADLARLGLVSRARITQIMNLLSLHPKIQESLLFPVATPPTEHHLRPLTLQADWTAQLRLWDRLTAVAEL